MRWLLFVIAIGACGKAAPDKAQEQPAHGEDRKEPAAAPKLSLAVTIDGAAQTWSAAEFGKVAKLPGTATDGNARDTWSLRELAKANAGDSARVAAVTGGGGRVVIEPAAWSDPERIPIIHGTRRGTLKFRWADKAGKWGETDANDVSAIEIVTK